MSTQNIKDATPQELNVPKAQITPDSAKGFERFMYNASKKLVWLLTINGCLWIWMSYLLALLGREQIAESLSSNVCTVILGELMTFLLTKTIENVFRYNPKFGGDSTFPDDIITRETATAQAQFAVAQAQAQAQSFVEPVEDAQDESTQNLYVDPTRLD